MKKYEAVFILDTRKVEDEGKAFSEEFSKLIQSWGGSMTEVKLMGRKNFMREIKRRKAGAYVDFVFDLETAKINDLREQFRLDERVLRHMEIIYDRPENARTTISSVEMID